MRHYLPKPEAIEGKWKEPPIKVRVRRPRVAFATHLHRAPVRITAKPASLSLSDEEAL
jgi:hypothetical protein